MTDYDITSGHRSVATIVRARLREVTAELASVEIQMGALIKRRELLYAERDLAIKALDAIDANDPDDT